MTRVHAVTELWSYRSLISNLVQRDLRARYKKSLLGWLWSLINPLSLLLIYSLVFGTFLKVTPPPAHNPDVQSFALYLFVGLITWNAFAGVLNGAMYSLEGMGSLLTKVYFPPAAPALSTAATAFTQTLIEAGVLLLVNVVVGNASWAMLLLPLALVPVAVAAFGVGIALSTYHVLYRDVGYLVTILLNVLFYATPIVYPLELVPEELAGLPLRRIFELNPLTQFVQMARDLVYFGRLPIGKTVPYSIVVAAVLLLLGSYLFNRKARAVVEEL